jgi:hypothetical protein
MAKPVCIKKMRVEAYKRKKASMDAFVLVWAASKELEMHWSNASVVGEVEDVLVDVRSERQVW